MRVVMNELIIGDMIEVNLPITPLSLGITQASIEENLKANFESIGLELVEYGASFRNRFDGFVRLSVAGELFHNSFHA